MSGLFSSPSTPPIKSPAPMPDMESPAVMEAARRRRGTMMGTSGRASTILSGDDYSRTTVG